MNIESFSFFQRRSNRHLVRIECEVVRVRDGLPLGFRTLDLSAHGLSLATNARILTGEEVRIELDIPATRERFFALGYVARVVHGRRPCDTERSLGIEFDACNERIGLALAWLVLAAVLVSAGNAAVRYAFGLSSNAWLEIQWYLFAAIFLLGAGHTLKRNEHVRVDVVATRLSPRQQAWIDIAGGVLFLMPVALVILYFSWPMFVQSYVGQEMSSDAGGLLRWPVKLLIPAGFALLVLQGLSEIIKRAAFLMGMAADPRGRQPERS